MSLLTWELIFSNSDIDLGSFGDMGSVREVDSVKGMNVGAGFFDVLRSFISNVKFLLRKYFEC